MRLDARISVFFIVQFLHPYMTTGKTIALTRWTFVAKVMFLLFNMLSRVGHSFSSKEQASFNFMAAVTSAVILEPQKIMSVTVSTVSPSMSHEDGTGCHDLRFLNVDF